MEKFDQVMKSIEDACLSQGRRASEISIIPATKCVGVEVINSLPSLGLTIVGENKAQELLSKFDKTVGVDYHFIGNLQTNKVKSIIDKVTMIQSVDRISLLQEINKQAEIINKTMDILIEVNIANDMGKGGVTVDNYSELAELAAKCEFVKLKGLMAVLPIGADVSLYDRMHEMYSELRAKQDGIEFLSMGMSGDYITAILHGANMVRLGSALFGARQYVAARVD